MNIKKQKSTKILTYEVIFEEAEEGGYSVSVLSLPGCISEGDTFEEAKKNITEAIKLYLEDLESEGEEIPRDNKSTFIGKIEVDINRSSVTL